MNFLQHFYEKIFSRCIPVLAGLTDVFVKFFQRK